MAEILEKALDLALERKDPRKKLERRKKKEASRSESSPDDVRSKKERKSESEPAQRRSRYIPSSLRERLLERASEEEKAIAVPVTLPRANPFHNATYDKNALEADSSSVVPQRMGFGLDRFALNDFVAPDPGVGNPSTRRLGLC